MSSISPINLSDPAANTGQVAQLYRYVELYSEGDPLRHSLFVLGRPPLADFTISDDRDELLIIDPPDDVTARFNLIDHVAVLFTGPPAPIDLPLVETVPDGVGHIRIGEHYIDVYSQAASAYVYLPALGLLCTGDYGSDASLPAVAEESDGMAELDVLVQLARMVKQHRIQLMIPRLGQPAHDKAEMLERLAGDVAYIHQLRRIATGILQLDSAALMEAADTLLPSSRRTATAQAVNRANLSRLQATMRRA